MHGVYWPHICYLASYDIQIYYYGISGSTEEDLIVIHCICKYIPFYIFIFYFIRFFNRKNNNAY